jgi:excisionase family DNA binding protein
MKKISFTVKQTCALIGVGKTKLYEILGSGELPAKKCGNRTLILKADLEKFLSNLDAYKAGNGGA